MTRAPRPAEICRLLLGALEASEGRRRRRRRDTTPDALGLALKRGLLEAAVRRDPDAREFETWLLEEVRTPLSGSVDPAPGAVLAMARAVLDEWRLAVASPEFLDWLRQGAHSDDAGGAGEP